MAGVEQVYTGPWINYSKGVILGATITLKARHSSILTAFLAAFIGFVGSQLWFITSFILHQRRSSLADKDGLFHQRQIIFRNTRTPLSAAWQFTKQWWAWKKVMDGTFLRSFGWILFATVFALLFAACSILVGEVTGAESSARLLKPENCGLLFLNSVKPGTGSEISYNMLTVNASNKAGDYAKRCYSDTSPTLGCIDFIQPSLNVTTNANASCPFGDGMCVYSNTAAFSMDTGLLDSRDHLGVNSDDSGRIAVRKLTTCAPLVVADYVTSNNSTIAPDWLHVQILAGPTSGSNATFDYETVSSATGQGWDLTPALSMNTIDSEWTPIPKFNRTDADVTLVFITSNSVYFSAPNDDPIFKATLSKFNNTNPDGSVSEFFDSNKYIGTIGCTEQFQICHPDGSGCTQLDGIYALIPRALQNSVPFSVKQFVNAARFSNAVTTTLLYHSLAGRGPSALKVQEMVHGVLQGALPPNQWMLEVLGWTQTSLAGLQQAFSDYVAQPADLAGYHVQLSTDSVSQAMCHSQLSRTSNGTISFSALGVGLILALGGLIILTSLIIEPLVGLIQRKMMKSARYKELNWILDDQMQIQRMMYEGAGMGGKWRNPKAAVPTTTEPTTFGGWSGLDHEHPSIQQLRKERQAQQSLLQDDHQHGSVQYTQHLKGSGAEEWRGPASP